MGVVAQHTKFSTFKIYDIYDLVHGHAESHKCADNCVVLGILV